MPIRNQVFSVSLGATRPALMIMFSCTYMWKFDVEVFKVEICGFNVEMLKELCLIDTGPHNDMWYMICGYLYLMWLCLIDRTTQGRAASMEWVVALWARETLWPLPSNTSGHTNRNTIQTQIQIQIQIKIQHYGIIYGHPIHNRYQNPKNHHQFWATE